MKCKHCNKKESIHGSSCQKCAEKISSEFWKNVREKMVKGTPEGWYLYTMACPIQYMKDVTIKGQKYQGYLRSRWDCPFSIEIKKIQNNGDCYMVWGHEPVDLEDKQPPIKSMKLIDKELERIKNERKGKKS